MRPEPSSPALVSVIIVSFNTREQLRKSLDCIEPHHEIIVVDNASVDGSPEMVTKEFPGVKLIASPTNLGFGGGNNVGLDAATGDLALFLNSDAYAFPGAIDLLAESMEDSGVVGAGGKLLNVDGSLQNSTAQKLTLWHVFGEQFFINTGYWTTTSLAATNEAKETPQVMGACFLVKRLPTGEFLKFDERYFLYCEDTDYAKRLSAYGRTLYVPLAQFTHELGASSRRSPWLGVIRYNAGKELYFRLHHGWVSELICLIFNRLGALLRLFVWTLIGLVKRRKREKIGLFWRVLTAPRGFARPSPTPNQTPDKPE